MKKSSIIIEKETTHYANNKNGKSTDSKRSKRE